MARLKDKKWDIPREITFIMPTGQSGIVWVPSRGKSYLRNRRFIKLNPEFKFENEEEQGNPPRDIYMTCRRQEVLAMQSLVIRTNKKGAARRKEQEQRKLSFSELDLVGPACLPVKGKTVDGKDVRYRERILKVNC